MRKAIPAFIFCFAIGTFLSCAQGANNEKSLESGTAGKGDPGYTYKITIEKMQFNWIIEDKNLRVKLKAQTAGWVGIGFSPTKGMKDANFVLGFVENGVATVSNQHGTAPTLHMKNIDLGGANHVMNPSGAEKNNETEISFAFPFSTGDELDRPIIVNGDTSILLAYGQAKQLAQVHLFRAKLKVNLSNGKYSVLLMTGK
ncbi:MAG: hypothetical protein A2W19_03125 [Spirochaetes bacterium RBG_16_49_21]|nr:MAG: hypothetical protein A2W19_03125 [Spirochaetes bacterium RBG_16_49_21]